MVETIQKPEILSIFVFESVSILETVTKIDVIMVEICDIHFSVTEMTKLRNVLRISIGEHADSLSEEDLSNLGSSMLQATSVALKAKYLRTKRKT